MFCDCLPHAGPKGSALLLFYGSDARIESAAAAVSSVGVGVGVGACVCGVCAPEEVDEPFFLLGVAAPDCGSTYSNFLESSVKVTGPCPTCAPSALGGPTHHGARAARTSFVRRTSIIAPNRPSVHTAGAGEGVGGQRPCAGCTACAPHLGAHAPKIAAAGSRARGAWTRARARGAVQDPVRGRARKGAGVPLIFSCLYISPIRLRKDPYKSREGPVAWEERASRE